MTQVEMITLGNGTIIPLEEFFTWSQSKQSKALMTAETNALRTAKCLITRASQSKEYKSDVQARRNNTIAARTPEEKAKTLEIISNKQKIVQAQRTSEEKAAIVTKRLLTLSTKPKKEKSERQVRVDAHKAYVNSPEGIAALSLIRSDNAKRQNAARKAAK